MISEISNVHIGHRPSSKIVSFRAIPLGNVFSLFPSKKLSQYRENG